MPKPRFLATTSSVARYYTTAEDSEWYSPPPPATKREGKPAETIVKSPQDLRDFLYGEEDGRLTVVKYHASWYVRW